MIDPTLSLIDYLAEGRQALVDVGCLALPLALGDAGLLGRLRAREVD
jgi:hypothetical protein